ncbi:ABC transporter permease [Tyzzerella sp. OttesenSCG-928-J15]|nr:ABC transporter permease [Tyzzerella sp. OttesenSCG-928-J15]
MIDALFPNVLELFPSILKALKETLIMVSISGLFATILGTPVGILLVVTKPNHIWPHRRFNSALSKVINILRSIPFVILIAAIPWLVRAIVGTTIGVKGAIVPLVISCFPFVSRQVELALLKIDSGVIEAYQAMGFDVWGIITKVLLKEGKGGIIQAVTVSLVSLVGFSAIAGSVGGGGLGDFAIRYGYNMFKNDVMVVTIVIILSLVFAIQWAGDMLYKKTLH